MFRNQGLRATAERARAAGQARVGVFDDALAVDTGAAAVTEVTISHDGTGELSMAEGASGWSGAYDAARKTMRLTSSSDAAAKATAEEAMRLVFYEGEDGATVTASVGGTVGGLELTLDMIKQRVQTAAEYVATDTNPTDIQVLFAPREENVVFVVVGDVDTGPSPLFIYRVQYGGEELEVDTVVENQTVERTAFVMGAFNRNAVVYSYYELDTGRYRTYSVLVTYDGTSWTSHAPVLHGVTDQSVGMYRQVMGPFHNNKAFMTSKLVDGGSTTYGLHRMDYDGDVTLTVTEMNTTESKESVVGLLNPDTFVMFNDGQVATIDAATNAVTRHAVGYPAAHPYSFGIYANTNADGKLYHCFGSTLEHAEAVYVCSPLDASPEWTLHALNNSAGDDLYTVSDVAPIEPAADGSERFALRMTHRTLDANDTRTVRVATVSDDGNLVVDYSLPAVPYIDGNGFQGTGTFGGLLFSTWRAETPVSAYVAVGSTAERAVVRIADMAALSEEAPSASPTPSVAPSSSGGLKWWAWVLIAAAVLLLALGAWAYRRRRARG